MKFTLIACLVTFIVVIVGRSIAINIVSSKLTKYLYSNDTKRYNELKNSRLSKMFIHPFNLRFMDLSKAIFSVDTKEVKKAIKSIEELRLNDKQRELLYIRCFYYYLSIEDYKDAKDCYNKVKALDPEKDNLEIDRLYDTYIDKGYKYLDITLEQFKKAKLEERVNIESIIIKMYENCGNTEKYNEFIEYAEKDINKLEKIYNSKKS